jgi:hypothetical protein
MLGRHGEKRSIPDLMCSAREYPHLTDNTTGAPP